MAESVALENILLIIIYSGAWVVGTIAVFMYRHAYLHMKRTRIIRALMLLLVAILIQDLYFGIRTIATTIHAPLGEILFEPSLWIIPKALVVIALTHFLWASTNPDQAVKAICKAAKKVRKDGGKLR